MIYFTGDINLTDNSFDVGYGVGSAIKRGWNPFHHIQKNEGDVWIGNFEGVTATASDQQGYKRNSFRIQPELIQNLGLIDYWGVANNHSMEHGPAAFQEMRGVLSALSKGVFGSDDKRSVTFEHDGRSVAVTGFSLRDDQLGASPLYWNFPDVSEVRAEYESIKDADLKVAYIHWGVEFIGYPNWEQRVFAHSLIDMGFDLIVGMHPHVLQGYEVYRGRHIFYSLGNFVFNQGWENTKYGLVVKVGNQGEVSFDYIKIQKDFAPKVIDERDVPQSLRLEHLNEKIALSENPERYVAHALKGLALFRKYNHQSILKNLYRNDKPALFGMVWDFLKRRLGF